MDHERCIENEKPDEFMLPGFRFHPTDEELVGFYLRRKIMQKPLSIELIRQLDIYKYDPWDLPKLATTGEKEWYFYCPRDRKYRNSTRPNRVTGAGFWKATGTDRPIYSSERSKCIGLKKSLVFYKGRAAKGVKTNWMMHEFRLPSTTDPIMPKKYLDKNIPANEAWAICRIFKKASSSTQRALSNSWVPPLFDITTSSDQTITNPCPNVVFNNVDFITTNLTSSVTNKPNPTSHFGFCNNMIEQLSSFPSFPPLLFPPYKPPTSPILENNRKPSGAQHLHEISEACGRKYSFQDASSLLQDMSTSFLGGCDKGLDNNENMHFTTHFNGFSPHANELEEGVLVSDGINVVGHELVDDDDDERGLMTMMMRSSMGYSCNGPLASSLENGWKSSLVWDYASPCPSDLSTSYSPNNCYT